MGNLPQIDALTHQLPGDQVLTCLLETLQKSARWDHPTAPSNARSVVIATGHWPIGGRHNDNGPGMGGLSHEGELGAHSSVAYFANMLGLSQNRQCSGGLTPGFTKCCGNGNERREKVYLVECERSGAHLEIPYLFLLTDCECGTRNLSTSSFLCDVRKMRQVLTSALCDS